MANFIHNIIVRLLGIDYSGEIIFNKLFQLFLFFSCSVDYANNTLFVVNGPDFNQDREIAGYGFNMNSGDVSIQFGKFLDPHDLAVTSDAREVCDYERFNIDENNKFIFIF